MLKSKMAVTASVLHGKTQMEDVYFEAPYKVMSPFWEDGTMEIMQMSSSAGLLNGDSFSLDILVKEGANLRYVSQSYDKVFDTQDGFATKELHMNIEESAHMEYMPYPVIPFGGSDYRYRGEVRVHETAFLAYADIFTCGRTGMGEYYKMKSFDSVTKIYIGNKLDFVDHTRIRPAELDYRKIGMWGEYTHNGMLYLYSPKWKADYIPDIQNIIEAYGLLSGISSTEKGIIIRTLGYRGDDLFRCYREILNRYRGLL